MILKKSSHPCLATGLNTPTYSWKLFRISFPFTPEGRAVPL